MTDLDKIDAFQTCLKYNCQWNFKSIAVFPFKRQMGKFSVYALQHWLCLHWLLCGKAGARWHMCLQFLRRLLSKKSTFKPTFK